MISKRSLAVAFIMLVLIFSSLYSLPVHAVTATLVATPSSPSGRVPVQTGVTYYNSFEYSVSYYYGTVFKVDLTGLTSSNLTGHTTTYLNRIFFDVAADTVSGNLAATRRIVGNDLTPDGLSVISTSTGAITDVLDGLTGAPNYQNEFDGVGYCNSNFCVAAGSVLFQVKSTSPFSVTQYSTGIGPQNTAYYGFRCDASNNVWFTEKSTGQLCKFNGSAISCQSGFSSALDVALVSSTLGYVSGYTTSNIYSFNPQTGSQTGSPTATGGTPYGLVVVAGSLYWADNSGGKQVCLLGGVCVGTTKQPAFLTTDGVNIIFGYTGSDGVGSLPASAFSGSSSTSSSSSSSTSSTSSSTATTTTSTTTTVTTCTQWFVPPPYNQPCVAEAHVPAIQVDSVVGLNLFCFVSCIPTSLSWPFHFTSSSTVTINGFLWTNPTTTGVDTLKNFTLNGKTVLLSSVGSGWLCEDNGDALVKSQTACNYEYGRVNYQTFNATISLEHRFGLLDSGINTLCFLAYGNPTLVQGTSYTPIWPSVNCQVVVRGP